MGARCSDAARRFSSDARRCYPPRGVASSPRLMLARSPGMRAAHDFIPGILVAAASGRRPSGSRRAGRSRPSMHPPEKAAVVSAYSFPGASSLAPLAGAPGMMSRCSAARRSLAAQPRSHCTDAHHALAA